MELFNNIIWWINVAIIILFGGLFLFQFLFMFLCFLKPRKYPEAKKIHHFTFIIRAHNEEDVIIDSVKSCLSVNYPEDKFKVIVFAHNCKDNTAKIAREAGARVIEISDSNPKSNLAFSMKTGLSSLKQEGYQTEYFLLIDADNQVDKNYLNACNKAADDGVAVGRTFENSRNLTDNVISCMSGLWYIRDSRIACVGRSALKFGCVMNGPTSMIRSDLAFNWDAITNSEDLEFTLNRLIKEKMIVEYINEAVVYEDQPTTMDDVFKRNSRMGGGLNKLFWTIGIKCLGHFFKNLFKKDIPFGTKLSYLDQYSNIAIIPGSFVACVWFPFYYIYSLVYTGIVGPMNIWGLGAFDIKWFTIFIVIVLCAALFVPFWFQPAVSYIAERKRLFISNKKVVVISVIFFPAFMIIEAVAVIKGIILKSQWSKIKRSRTKINQ